MLLNSPTWVDDLLLAGPDTQVCLGFPERRDRRGLRSAVAEACEELRALGVAAGGSVAVSIPPSLDYIRYLLAAWRLGAQVHLLDHRLSDRERERALNVLASQVLVSATAQAGALRGWNALTAASVRRDEGRPAATDHAIIQLSSGSTGPSKVIGRHTSDLVTEIERYRQIERMPAAGERVVILNSLSHTMGLFGGLVYGLASGVELAVPERMTSDGIVAAIDAGAAPTSVMGVPFHYRLLGSVASDVTLPQLVTAMSAGEVMRPSIAVAFASRWSVPLGAVYGMTETGVLTADLAGRYAPSVGRPAPGIVVRVDEDELLVRRDESPYVGLVDGTRYVDGWLHTRDHAEIDPETGAVTIRGRHDSQVAIGGLKVDLTEVEQELAEVAGVAECVVLWNGAAIEAVLALLDGATVGGVEAAMAGRLADYKLPRRYRVVDSLPRTTTGKLSRDINLLMKANER
ncbi:MAG TPA: class I adenylate-forming enzyme family protein [Actinospica sp.]|nr:class I adenylate-forming enzyme family protein [Actinospica sp.]